MIEVYHLLTLQTASEGSGLFLKNLKSLPKPERFAVIVGNEITGVSKETLDASDVVAKIPMLGNKESLNVSVATGIALFVLS